MELSSISIAITSLVGALFSPGAMFATGVNGAWYDPSDFSTLFQDAAGTTPVTAVGQPVGLMLDKSKGLVLGNESAINGTFTTDTNWIKGSGCTISGESLNYNGTAGTVVTYQSTPTLTIGKTYLVTYTITNYVAGNIDVRTGSGGLSVTASANGTYSRILTCQTSAYIYVTGYSGFNGSVSRISVRELPGNHAFNPSGNSANFPVLQQDGTGRYYLSLNGVNQWLQTNSIDFTYGDKMFVCAGVRKLSDAARGMLIEFGATNTSSGFEIDAPFSGGNYQFASGGTSIQGITASATAPITNVVSGIGDIAAPSINIRLNGAFSASNSASQGTGAFGNKSLYIGSRAGTSLWFNGRLYGLVIAGKQASDSEIDGTEAWLNQKTGAY